jgi:hypothetical protein
MTNLSKKDKACCRKSVTVASKKSYITAMENLRPLFILFVLALLLSGGNPNSDDIDPAKK